jgi:hypothetical protein
MDRSSVVELIRSAWSVESQPLPEDIPYDNSGRHFECAAVGAFFAGKAWEEMTWSVLSTYKGDRSACLCFMSPSAFRYYLANYMVIAIEHYREADVTGDSAWYSLEPSRGRVAELSHSLRAPIYAFLEYMVITHADEAPYAGRADILLNWQAAR